MRTQTYDNLKKHFGKNASVLPALGAGVIGMYLVRRWLDRRGAATTTDTGVVDETERPDVVDEASKESFPASDPPSW